MSSFSYDPKTGRPRRRGSNQDAFIRALPKSPLFGGDVFDRQVAAGEGGYGGGGLSPTGPSYPDLNIAGTKPDFLGILNSDALLRQFRTDLGAESITDQAQRDTAIRRALAGFGLIPEGEFAQYADAETRRLAELGTSEQLSTVGRLNRERNRGQQNLMDALAARGALRSGATGVAMGELQQDYKTALTDAESQLLDYMSGAQRAYLDAERQRVREIAQAQSEAARRIPPEQLAGTPAEEAVLIGFTPDGRPVYEGKTSKKRFLDPQTPWDGPVNPEPPQAPEPEPELPAWFDPIPVRPAENVVRGQPLRVF